MAEKKFDTRILLKYDSLSNWNNSTLVLKAGEVAIATVPATEAVTKNADGVITPPAAVVFKVGDGEHTFKDLPLTSGLAADVYGWAKKDESEFISWLEGKNKFALKSGLDNLSAEVSAIDAAYKKADKELSDLIDSITGGTGDVEGLGALSARITDLETVLTSFIGEDENGNVTTDAVKAAIDAVANKVSTLEGKVESLESAKDLMSADIAKLKTAIGTQEEGSPSIAEQIGSVATDVENLESSIGEVADGKTVVGMISDAAKDAKDYTDNAIAGVSSTVGTLSPKVEANEEAIAVLNGEGEGSVKKQVADAIAEVVANADEDFDTLKEIADYIASDKTNAASINNKLSAHDTSIAGLESKDTELVEDIADLQEQINAIVGGDGSTGTLVSLENRVKANEEAIVALQTKDNELVNSIASNTSAIEALQAKDTTLTGLISDNSAAIAAEKERAEGEEATLLGLINAEVARAQKAEGDNKTLIDTLDAKVEALHKVASSGLINDLSQSSTEELVFDCGNASGYNAAASEE